MTLMIREELVGQCKNLKPADRPFNINNPGDDPHFHKVVASIKEDLILHMAEKCAEVIEG